MKTWPSPAVLALFGLFALALAAQAQGTVWRCGPDGRSYSDSPCTDGRPLAVVTERPAADVQAAQQMAVRERQLADRLVSERLQREALVLRTAPAKAAGAETVKSAASTAKQKTLKAQKTQQVQEPRRAAAPEAPGIWRAVAPVSRPKKG